MRLELLANRAVTLSQILQTAQAEVARGEGDASPVTFDTAPRRAIPAARLESGVRRATAGQQVGPGSMLK